MCLLKLMPRALTLTPSLVPGGACPPGSWIWQLTSSRPSCWVRDEGELSVGELGQRLGVPQPKVSNHLACLRWCGFIEARREHRVVFNRIADQRVLKMLELAHALLEDNEEHIAACCRIEETQ
jgi:DNA-binding transcriptional ArsR family regulator